MTEASVFEGKKAVYFTLGCKLNFAETSTIGRFVEGDGSEDGASQRTCRYLCGEYLFGNGGCDHKCRQAIHKLVKQHPGAFVVVTGCYAQLKPEQVSAIDGVDLVLGQSRKGIYCVI